MLLKTDSQTLFHPFVLECCNGIRFALLKFYCKFKLWQIPNRCSHIVTSKHFCTEHLSIFKQRKLFERLFDALTLPINNFQQHSRANEQKTKKKKRRTSFNPTLFSVASFNANILRWTENNTSKQQEQKRLLRLPNQTNMCRQHVCLCVCVYFGVVRMAME